jgi:hypothetical protein
VQEPAPAPEKPRVDVKKKTQKKSIQQTEEKKVEPAPNESAAGPVAPVVPPSSGDGAAPPPASASTEGTEAAPAPPLDTTGAGSVAPAAEETEQAPARESSPFGTWLLVGGLAVGLAIVVKMTMRRRKDDDISIFDRSPAPSAPRPPIAHHP